MSNKGIRTYGSVASNIIESKSGILGRENAPEQNPLRAILQILHNTKTVLKEIRESVDDPVNHSLVFAPYFTKIYQNMKNVTNVRSRVNGTIHPLVAVVEIPFDKPDGTLVWSCCNVDLGDAPPYGSCCFA